MESPDRCPPLVPDQEAGVEKNFTRQHRADSTAAAEDLFVEAKERLLDVNRWHQFAGGGSARFQLMDRQCLLLNRPARKGDYIRIDLPGPASPVGGGFDWVYIEAIVYETDPDTDHECIGMRVRPTQAPEEHESAGPDHFFKDSATSTFVIEREHSLLIAGIYGRNEQPNTKEGSLIGWLRHGLVALSAFVGAAGTQWHSLIRGWLEGPES